MKENRNFSFFAAANGYGGFRSYFDEIFNPKEYTKIYILKGGPGTGKSTLMKSLYNALKDGATYTESIYCSSDPKSLDGIIIENENKKVAVIDGTAPHEKDACFPGAIDKIINLGDGWDKRWLEAKRDDIISLCDEKRNAYKTAYSYLFAAGVSHRAKCSLSVGLFDIENAQKTIKSSAESLIKTNSPFQSTRLISAFSKSGYVRFGSPNKTSGKHVGVYGSEEAVSKFLDLFRKGTAEKTGLIRFPSPLDDSITEGLYYPDSDFSITASTDTNVGICADEFYDIKAIDKERVRVFSDTEARHLKEAERWFNIASDIHMRLEEIYSAAMNFEKNDAITARLTEEISEKIRG